MDTTIDIIKSLSRNTSFCIKTNDGCTDMFSIETGEGKRLSSFLFDGSHERSESWC